MITYVVQARDSLYSIALRFGTTVEAIMQANRLTSPALYIGQPLSIPVSGPVEYVVQAGDSLYTISRKLNATIEAKPQRPDPRREFPRHLQRSVYEGNREFRPSS
ncbi:LysM peptidoglycan-binding domain-containing protein [Paenibacillus sp. y28]|uniref:LysM peptidoglycan-binding domain-containing protein n=1 Tax=Paenibacillus sp. y28 TaxID=3129110 RepID=UPI003FA6DC83